MAWYELSERRRLRRLAEQAYLIRVAVNGTQEQFAEYLADLGRELE
jgi:hypothetical protein